MPFIEAIQTPRRAAAIAALTLTGSLALAACGESVADQPNISADGDARAHSVDYTQIPGQAVVTTRFVGFYKSVVTTRYTCLGVGGPLQSVTSFEGASFFYGAASSGLDSSEWARTEVCGDGQVTDPELGEQNPLS